jgi:glycosyltransferase involved in cell wall biosynthesis
MGQRSIAPATTSSARRILYVAYPLLPVSRESCGGAEQMLSVLESEIALRGHRTTTAACNGSLARGTVLTTGAETTEPDSFVSRDKEHQARILAELKTARFDLIHDKSGSFWRRADECHMPILATLHLPKHFYPTESFKDVPANVYFNCVSYAQSSTFLAVPNMVAVVRNGIYIEQFSFTPEKQDYLLWMGRICEEKGPHLAIEIAQRTGLPLVLAGQVYPFSYHQNFYNTSIRPYLGGSDPRVCFIETPTFETKIRLLSNARALLIPSLVDETSSLVAMEAMACGTPVIGLRRGAIPEVVIDGLTGFVCNNVDEMAESVWKVNHINPHACRMHVEVNYPAGRMASEYEQLYEQVLALHANRNRLAA